MDNPVSKLDGIFCELGEDWDSLDDPEHILLDVPKGTVESLLRKIKKETCCQPFLKWRSFILNNGG